MVEFKINIVVLSLDANTWAVMDGEITKVACKAQLLGSEGLKLIHRWLNELEGSNRNVAFELMDQVMDGKITNEAAFALLESERD